MIQYKLNVSGDSKSLTLIEATSGDTRTLTEAHPSFKRVLDAVMDGSKTWDEIVDMVDDVMGKVIVPSMMKLSEHLRFDGTNLLWDGEVMDNAVSKHIVRLIREGDERYAAIVKFLERVAANPSQVSRVHLWSWLNANDFTITPDGMIVGYKGVQDVARNLSITRGNEDVRVNGVVYRGHIPNPIGALVEMPRTLVAIDRNVPCSVGLHVGTYAYASSFGSKLLHVLVDPADVVSVPRDCSAQKMRVSRYQVLAESPLRIETAIYDGYDGGDDEDDDYDECGECSCDCSNCNCDESYCPDCGCGEDEPSTESSIWNE